MKEILHCYCRVSSGAQEVDGTSLASQQQLGKLKAKQLNLTPQIWLEGAASSDSDDIDKREQLSSLMTAIDDGKVKHLFVTEQSRLARTDHIASMIRYRCNINGVTLYIKDTVYDFSNPMDVLTVQIMASFSQFENAIRKERSRLGKLQKVKQGYWHGGVPPYGYTLKLSKNGNKLVINKDEEKWVKAIFAWYRENQSIKYIQQKLRESYIQARRGGTFSTGSLQALLKNTHYTGSYIFTDGVSNETVEVKCPRIIDDALWNYCQKRRENIIKRKGQLNRATHVSLLKTFMWCGHCGNGIGAKIQPSQKKNYYYCPKKERVWKKSEGASVNYRLPSNGLNKDNSQTNQTKKYNTGKRGRHCKMVRSLNIPNTNQLVWGAVAEIASKSNVLKEQIKNEMMSSKHQSDADVKSTIRNLQKTKKQYMQERTDLENAVTKIETDRVMKRISAKQTKDIKANIKKELVAVTKQLDEVEQKLSDNNNQQRWIDWIGKFKKTYTNVDKFNEEKQKAYLDGLVERIDVRLDENTNEHMLDITFHFPVVGDRYIVLSSGKNGREYEVKKGKYVKTLKGDFTSKHYGRDGVNGKKTKKKQVSKRT